jgi:hypothetical protein
MATRRSKRPFGGRGGPARCCSRPAQIASAASSRASGAPRLSIRRHGETASGRPTSPSRKRSVKGVWQLGDLVDYVCKVCLACAVTATKTWRDAVAVLKDARDRAADLIGRSLLEDCTDPQTGEIVPVVVVFDNGLCYRAAGFACHIDQRPELAHVRTP